MIIFIMLVFGLTIGLLVSTAVLALMKKVSLIQVKHRSDN